MDSLVQPFFSGFFAAILIREFRYGISCQGIWLSRFSERNGKKQFRQFLQKKRARKLLIETKCEIADLLKILVGDESLFKRYLFDQQFSHQGWSGMVSIVESNPQTLLDTKKISMHDLIVFELLLEIDCHGLSVWPSVETTVREY